MFRALIKYFNINGLLKDGSILFVGMIGVHLLNLFFQLVMGRSLPANEYALLVTLLGMLNIFIIPLGVISTTVSRTTRLLVQENRAGDVKRFIFSILKKTILAGSLAGLLCFVFSDWLVSFLYLERKAPVLIFGVIMVGIFSRPVFDGALTGMEQFRDWTVASTLGWGMRLVVSSFLVLSVSLHAGWGLLGHVLGYYAAILMGAIAIRLRLRSAEVTSEPLPSVRGFVAATFFILLGLSIFMYSDIIIVKRLYPAAVDEFAYAATLGRLVIFIPQAFIMAMFPKVVSNVGASKEQFKVLSKTLILVLIVTVFGALIFHLCVPSFLRLLYGINEPSETLLLWCRLFAWCMIPVATLVVLVRYALAQKNYMAAGMAPVAAIIYFCILYVFQNGILYLLMSLGLVSLICSGLCYGQCLIQIRNMACESE